MSVLMLAAMGMSAGAEQPASDMPADDVYVDDAEYAEDAVDAEEEVTE